MNNYQKKLTGISCLVGNTPLLHIEFTYQGKNRRIFAKAEHMNMTGSIKDRMALHIIKNGFKKGILKEGNTIAEATSGNTGIAFASIGRALGHPVTIFMPEWMSEERKNLISSMGADIKLVSRDEGGFLGSIKRAENMAKTREGVFLPRQFSNTDNIKAHYITTGPEIWWQLRSRSIHLDAFVAGVGTGGTIMGVGRYLKEKSPDTRIYPLEPSNSPTLSTGHKVGKHRIQGISDDFIPPILDLDNLSPVISVDDGDSIIMAQKLSHQLGLGVGISSGANFLGAIKIQNQLGADAVVATVFADDNKKYLSTDLLKTEPQKADFLSKDVELLNFSGFKRVCFTCCNPSECTVSMAEDFAKEVNLPACARRQAFSG